MDGKRQGTWSLVVCSILAALGCKAPTIVEVQENEIVTYEVSLPAPQTQMVEVTMTFPTAGAETVEVLLPTWRPGRYTILDLAATVRSMQAYSTSGRVLPTRKVDKSTWSIQTGGIEEVRVRYAIYANSLGDRTRHVDSTHAFLSGSSIFMYTPRLRQAPVRVVISAPEHWEIAGGLERVAGEDSVLEAADYDVLVDSPIEIGEHDRIEFEVGGLPHEIIIWPKGVDHDSDHLIEDTTKLIVAQTEIFGQAPYSRYVFLIHAGAAGGGTEHLNSTIMQVSRSVLEGSRDRTDSYKRFLGLVAHEFFHTWNVKALRPAGIHPYDYQAENYTDLLWVSEGGTSYYGALTLVRSGLLSEKKFLKGLAKSINSLRNRPGTHVQSLSESSFDAWIKFSQSSADDINTEVSFYSKGSLAFLALDMEVRARSASSRSLDDVMRVMFETYPLEGPGFTTEDLIAVLDAETNSSFEEFFARHIASTEPLPLERVLETVGLELYFKRTEDGKKESEQEEDTTPSDTAPTPPPLRPYLGLRLRSGSSGALVSAVLSDGPAYSAGVIAGDEIISLDNRRLRSGDLDKRLELHEPGDTVTLHLLRADRLIEMRIALNGIPDGKWAIRRAEQASESQKSAYVDWLEQEWPEEADDKSDDEAEDDQ